MVQFGNLYLGNKMTRIPFFNAPWFDATAAQLRRVPGVDSVFSPADHDRELGLDPMLCPTGDPEEAAVFDVPAGKCLKDDLDWIAEFSNGMVVGPEWWTSPGTVTEIAFHQALHLPVWGWQAFKDAIELNDYDHLIKPEWKFPSLLNSLT